MPVRNKAAMAAAMVRMGLILMMVVPGVRADAGTAVSVMAVPGTDATATVKETGDAGIGQVPVPAEAADTVTTAGSESATTGITGSLATPPVPPPGSITLGMLEDVQQKNLLLAARVQTAQLQRQLAEAGSEASAVSGTGTVMQPGDTQTSSTVVPGQPEKHSTSHPPAIPRPQVLEISGKGSALHALLQMPDGSQPEVSAGSRVVIGKAFLTVRRISLSGVTLSDGSELSF